MKRKTPEPHVDFLEQTRKKTREKVLSIFGPQNEFLCTVENLQNVTKSILFNSDFQPASRGRSLAVNQSANNNAAGTQRLQTQDTSVFVPATKKIIIDILNVLAHRGKITDTPEDSSNDDSEEPGTLDEEGEAEEETEEGEQVEKEEERPTIPTHAQINEMTNSVKPLLMEISCQARHIKTWIGLSTPKYEAGNHQGIEVLELVGGLAESIINSIDENLNGLVDWFSTRAERIRTAVDTDSTEAWAALDLSDEIQFNNIKLMMKELHDSYVILIDNVVKNMDKIQQPRSSSLENVC